MKANFAWEKFLSLLASFIFISFIFSVKSYPYADDWGYAAVVNFSMAEFWKWVFAQHVDHFIPVQKIIHYNLAKWSGFDFRVLVLLNFIFAWVAIIGAMKLVKSYGKNSAWVNFWLVLCILIPSSTYSLWAFQFQFLSSIAFFLVAIYFLHRLNEGQINLSFGFIFLLLTAASGMNGFVLAIVSTTTISIYFFLFKRNDFLVSRINKFLYFLLLFEFLVIIFAWSPSDASKVESSILEKITVYYYLHAAPFSVAAFNGTAFYAFFVLMCSVFSIFLLIKKHIKFGLNFSDVVLLAAVFASELLLLVVALGRSGAQGGWGNVLMMHYGPLSLTTLIISWVIISAHAERSVKSLIGLLLIGLMTISYYIAYDWRKQYVNNVIAKQLEVEKSLTEVFDVSELVNRYALELTWQDSAEAKSHVEYALNEVLHREYPRYRRATPLFVLLDVKGDYLTVGVVGKSSVLSHSGFNGSDFYKTTVDGLVVFGSYVNSDADVGSILIKLRRGDRILYRSGPTFGNQLLIIEGENRKIIKLPVATEWRIMEFSNKNLPDEFLVEISDRGISWGEWSSVALLAN